MKLLLGIVAGCGLLAWAAGGPKNAAGDGKARSAATRPAGRPTATAPADGRAFPMPGPRKRLLEGPLRRDFGPPSGPERPLPPEKIEELMQFARENFPQIHQRLDRLRQVDPAQFHRILRKVAGRLLPVLEMKKNDPVLAQKMIEEHRLQMAILDLSDQYRGARSGAERSRLKAEIESRLREQFDRHQERMRLEIEHLRNRLDRQARLLADREKRKEELLRKEFDRLAKGPPPRPDDDRDWEPGPEKPAD